MRSTCQICNFIEIYLMKHLSRIAMNTHTCSYWIHTEVMMSKFVLHNTESHITIKQHSMIVNKLKINDTKPETVATFMTFYYSVKLSHGHEWITTRPPYSSIEIDCIKICL